MVYTSDLRGKHILRDLHIEIINELKNEGVVNDLFLRVFDNPHDDDKSWESGGLTFEDPSSKKAMGSNDGAWYYLNNSVPTPLVIVEATFGTERGQFGDGQFNRFSHPLAPAKLGYIGVMLIPFKGESYTKSDGAKGYDTDFASLKYAYLSKKIVWAALGISKKEKGQYLLLDFYDHNSLKVLIKESFKEKMGYQNTLSNEIDIIKSKMSKYAGNISKQNWKINPLYDTSGRIIQDSFGAIFSQNFAALTLSSKRDAHGLLGKTMSYPYLCPHENMYSIFLRLDSTEITNLKSRNGKEISYIFNNPTTNVIPRDHLIFSDKNLEAELISIKNVNLFKNSKKELIKQIGEELKSGKIRIKK